MAKYIHATINFYDITLITGYSRRRLRSQEKMHVDEFNTALAVLPNLLIHDNTQIYVQVTTHGTKKRPNNIDQGPGPSHPPLVAFPAFFTAFSLRSVLTEM
ncbi:hypothetical protein E4U37_003480 [Claviceps purpurea]|nr:hypothetical protein E4U37_003480 [Claviceps purpurea]